MENDERFIEYYTRLNLIMNSLWEYGIVYNTGKINSKILRSLTSAYHQKVVTILDVYNVNSMHIEELIEILQTYELSYLDIF